MRSEKRAGGRRLGLSVAKPTRQATSPTHSPGHSLRHLAGRRGVNPPGQPSPSARSLAPRRGQAGGETIRGETCKPRTAGPTPPGGSALPLRPMGRAAPFRGLSSRLYPSTPPPATHALPTPPTKSEPTPRNSDWRLQPPPTRTRLKTSNSDALRLGRLITAPKSKDGQGSAYSLND
jgi:hypothetical protein